jgi:predicted RNase H-like HicB family nuclease
MARGLIVVKAAYDADAAVWFVESCDLEGVNAEAPTLEELLQKLPGVILDLLEEEGFDDAEVPIELVAHARTRVRRGTNTVSEGPPGSNRATGNRLVPA